MVKQTGKGNWDNKRDKNLSSKVTVLFPGRVVYYSQHSHHWVLVYSPFKR